VVREKERQQQQMLGWWMLMTMMIRGMKLATVVLAAKSARSVRAEHPEVRLTLEEVGVAGVIPWYNLGMLSSSKMTSL
jgi:hypothetical protein